MNDLLDVLDSLQTSLTVRAGIARAFVTAGLQPGEDGEYKKYSAPSGKRRRPSQQVADEKVEIDITGIDYIQLDDITQLEEEPIDLTEANSSSDADESSESGTDDGADDGLGDDEDA